MHTLKCRAFTLIELLIVVAIIAILAAIAVPNFLEAQVRAKVSREKANMRSIATALESYRIDNNAYPMDGNWYNIPAIYPEGTAYANALNLDLVVHQRLFLITTPVAYMTSVPDAVFRNHLFGGLYIGKRSEKYYAYWSQEWKNLQIQVVGPPTRPEVPFVWSLTSTGPNEIDNFGSYLIFGQENLEAVNTFGSHGAQYDATNGTMSDGDIIRIGP